MHSYYANIVEITMFAVVGTLRFENGIWSPFGFDVLHVFRHKTVFHTKIRRALTQYYTVWTEKYFQAWEKQQQTSYVYRYI